MRVFYAKILLFGEYTVLSGSSSLTVPFRKFRGKLKIPRREISNQQFRSNAVLKKFCDHLKAVYTVREVAFDFKSFSDDLEAGLYFDSDIPQYYGIGSSGALVAAVFHHYALRLHDADLPGLRTLFAEAESFFHGKSSGIDPLSCYCDIPLLIRDQGVQELDTENIDSQLKRFSLLDTGKPAATGDLVTSYLEKMQDYPVDQFNLYQDAVENAVNAIIENSRHRLSKAVQEISSFQLDFFGDRIPEPARNLWEEGLETGRYFMKLCGSGGGGYFLVFTPLGKSIMEGSIPVWER